MSPNENYTEFARRFSFNHPIRSFVGIQVIFWSVANLLLGTVIHLLLVIIGEIYSLPHVAGFSGVALTSVLLGFMHGVGLGLFDFYTDKNISKRQSLGRILIVKSAASLLVLTALFVFIRYIVFPLMLGSFFNSLSSQPATFWHIVLLLLGVYYFFMSLLISFINQVNKKFGPGILIPLLLGKYRSPREEDKIIMFMDLNASTTIAEKLGHIKYSGFIRDSFLDINLVVPHFSAEIYQYVGDEIVLAWPFHNGVTPSSCIRFFFECEKRWKIREEYYVNTYGVVPSFKAGVHLGKVTVVEIGDIKKEIAYHGDTMNTTARILSLCNEYQRKILVSNIILDNFPNEGQFLVESLGKIKLKGKMEEVGVASIQLA